MVGGEVADQLVALALLLTMWQREGNFCQSAGEKEVCKWAMVGGGCTHESRVTSPCCQCPKLAQDL